MSYKLKLNSLNDFEMSSRDGVLKSTSEHQFTHANNSLLQNLTDLVKNESLNEGDLLKFSSGSLSVHNVSNFASTSSVTDVASDLSTLDNTVSAINTSVQSIGISITALEGSQASTQTQLDDVQTSVDALESVKVVNVLKYTGNNTSVTKTNVLYKVLLYDTDTDVIAYSHPMPAADDGAYRTIAVRVKTYHKSGSNKCNEIYDFVYEKDGEGVATSLSNYSYVGVSSLCSAVTLGVSDGNLNVMLNGLSATTRIALDIEFVDY